jgi:hypothetical protein
VIVSAVLETVTQSICTHPFFGAQDNLRIDHR